MVTKHAVKRRERARPGREPVSVERVQIGARMEKRLVKVLKALAELKDLTLGDLLEGIVLHAFDGKAPFTPETLAQIAELKKVYGLDLDSSASHRMIEPGRFR
jgi:hypothetical protein